MNEITVNSLSDFFKNLPPKPTINWAYRGQKEDWDIVPGLCRGEFSEVKQQISQRWQDLEGDLLERFKRESVPFLGIDPKYSKLEWLAMAQHYRLPTRFLDFTKSPLVALFFAVDGETNSASDSVVWALYTENWFSDETNRLGTEPLDKIDSSLQNEGCYLPRHINTRITAQKSCLYVCSLYIADNAPPDEFTPLNERTDLDLVKYVIKSSVREQIRHQIYGLGIDYYTLFPDLEGLSKKVAWEVQSMWKHSTFDSFS